MSYEHRETMRMGIDRALYDIEDALNRIAVATKVVSPNYTQRKTLVMLGAKIKTVANDRAAKKAAE